MSLLSLIGMPIRLRLIEIPITDQGFTKVVDEDFNLYKRIVPKLQNDSSLNTNGTNETSVINIISSHTMSLILEDSNTILGYSLATHIKSRKRTTAMFQIHGLHIVSNYRRNGAKFGRSLTLLTEEYLMLSIPLDNISKVIFRVELLPCQNVSDTRIFLTCVGYTMTSLLDSTASFEKEYDGDFLKKLRYKDMPL